MQSPRTIFWFQMTSLVLWMDGVTIVPWLFTMISVHWFALQWEFYSSPNHRKLCSSFCLPFFCGDRRRVLKNEHLGLWNICFIWMTTVSNVTGKINLKIGCHPLLPCSETHKSGWRSFALMSKPFLLIKTLWVCWPFGLKVYFQWEILPSWAGY